jgi:hypothetical protein
MPPFRSGFAVTYLGITPQIDFLRHCSNHPPSVRDNKRGSVDGAKVPSTVLVTISSRRG